MTIARPFAVGRFHVTRDQFAAFVAETGYQAITACRKYASIGAKNGSWRDPGFAQEGSHPVVCISWDDAKAYVSWLAKTTGKEYPLLSEAEWEYAARGQTTPGKYPRYWFGDDETDVCRYANSFASQCDDGFRFTSPVGRYAANAFDLYDMVGNAMHGRKTATGVSYKGVPVDGSAAICNEGLRLHVVRGGSWINPATPYLRSAARLSFFSAATHYLGVRAARSLNGHDDDHR